MATNGGVARTTALAKAVVSVLKGRNDLDEGKIAETINELCKDPAALIKETDRV